MLQTKVVKGTKTHFMFNKSRNVRDNVEKCGSARQAKHGDVIRRMYFACRQIRLLTHTHHTPTPTHTHTTHQHPPTHTHTPHTHTTHQHPPTPTHTHTRNMYTYCCCSAPMVTRTRFNVTLYVHCLVTCEPAVSSQ
jgi:hypothetical protein